MSVAADALPRGYWLNTMVQPAAPLPPAPHPVKAPQLPPVPPVTATVNRESTGIETLIGCSVLPFASKL